MGLMTFLRNRAGFILVGVIGLAIVAFLVGDAVKVGKPFWADSQKVVGNVGGTDIKIEDFSAKVEQNEQNFKAQMGGQMNPQMQSYVVENTWNQQVNDILLAKEIDRLGLQISSEELFDLVQGKTPSPIIAQYFTGKDGQFNRAAVIQSRKEADKNPQLKKEWQMLENEIEKQRLSQKYYNMVRNSVYVTSLEAADEYVNRNKLANFRYVNLEYASIPDNQVKLTDADYNEFYNENKNRFKAPEETRSFDYVVFEAKPSASDSAMLKANVEKMSADFKTTKNDSLYAAINSDVKVPFSYIKKGSLDPAVDSAIFKLDAGSYYGPVFSNGSYKIAKVIGAKISPDSVKARHILINATTEGGVDKAKHKADSIKTLIAKGADFAELAKKFGTDGSKDQGGDLGTFGRGAMFPEFEEPVFNAKTGDVIVITSRAGVHIVNIQKQVGSSKVMKVAYIEKKLSPSSKTQQEAYAKASAFLTETSAATFNEQAQKKGYRVLVADRTGASQGVIPGISNSRPIVRAAYDAKVGALLPQVYESDNVYVVAKLTAIRPKGIQPLELVKKEIEPAVRNAVKGKQLKEKMDKALAGSSSIDQVAQKAGRTVYPVQNIVFANPVIPGVAQENAVVGTVFGAKPGKVSKSVIGERGVYAFVVDGFTQPAPLSNTFKLKEQILGGLAQRAMTESFKVLRDKSEIKDNRAKFY